MGLKMTCPELSFFFFGTFFCFCFLLNYGTSVLLLICPYLERKQNMPLFNLCGTNSSCVRLIMLRTKRILRPLAATGLDPEKSKLLNL